LICQLAKKAQVGIMELELAGQEIGRYRIISLIGHGANGDVYLAEDPRIQQQVAIKVFQNDTSPAAKVEAGDNLAIFRDEARAIDRLKHPRIVHLNYYDEATIAGKSIIYIVTPYYKDGSLAKWLQERGVNKLSLEDITHLVSQAADGLQYAHNFQIVHRDVKPSNFLIDTEGITNPNRPNVLLTDFGIAKSITSTSASAGQTSAGGLAYMAPEQFSGQAVFASDQYALAIIAYELLSGHPPFQGTPTVIMRQHIENQPEPPGATNPNIPKAIDTVILRALAKKPEDRFGSVEAFSTAFQRGSGIVRQANEPGVRPQRESGPISPPRDPSIGGPVDQSKGQHADVPPVPPAPPIAQRGQDIHTTLVINPAEAQRGTNKTLTLGRRNVYVTVPPNAYNGLVLHLEGQGEPSPAGGPAGTLHITISVAAYQQEHYPPPPPPMNPQYQWAPARPMSPPYQPIRPPVGQPYQQVRPPVGQPYQQFLYPAPQAPKRPNRVLWIVMGIIIGILVLSVCALVLNFG
jgi:serine/threonine protein kinase